MMNFAAMSPLRDKMEAEHLRVLRLDKISPEHNFFLIYYPGLSDNVPPRLLRLGDASSLLLEIHSAATSSGALQHLRNPESFPDMIWDTFVCALNSGYHVMLFKTKDMPTKKWLPHMQMSFCVTRNYESHRRILTNYPMLDRHGHIRDLDFAHVWGKHWSDFI